MEIEAVHASPWCQEDTGLLVKMRSHIHQNLVQEQEKKKEYVIIIQQNYRSVHNSDLTY